MTWIISSFLQVNQLSEATGEESLILTASVSDGSFTHLGTRRGKTFLQKHDNLKTQFLGFCLTGTVNFLYIRTPKQFVVITLKFELCGFNIE